MLYYANANSSMQWQIETANDKNKKKNLLICLLKLGSLAANSKFNEDNLNNSHARMKMGTIKDLEIQQLLNKNSSLDHNTTELMHHGPDK